MAAETNLITTAQMKKVREVDFVEQFAHNHLAKLMEALGVTRKIPMMEGTTMYVYSVTGTLQDGNVAEGDIIPLSRYETEKTPVGEITLHKWRKAVSAEAIKKSGYSAAVLDTDAALLRDVQKGIRSDFFAFIRCFRCFFYQFVCLLCQKRNCLIIQFGLIGNRRIYKNSDGSQNQKHHYYR